MKNIDIELEGIYREDENVTRARNKALSLLSYSDYTLKKMYERLKGYGFDDEVINEVLHFLVDRKYINEPLLLEKFVKYCAVKKQYGRNRVISMVKAKGFAGNVLSEHLEICLEEIDFDEICLECAKKIKNLDTEDRISREKAIRSLVYRGFGISQIKKALLNLNGN